MDTTASGDENPGEIPMDIGGAEPGLTGEGGESSSSPDFPWPFGSGRDSGTRSTGRDEPQEESTQHAVSSIGLDLCQVYIDAVNE